MAEDAGRTDRLLALILVNLKQGSTQRENIHLLNAAGLSNVEIADLLQTTAANVAQVLYEGRKAKKVPKSRRKGR